MRFFEKSILLRPLNYLRIKHDFSVTYNWIYPPLFSGAFLAILLSFNSNVAIFGNNGLISKLLQLLILLAPFYIAALAAISTFGPNSKIDDLMKGVVTPNVLLRSKGQWVKVELTTRHFLSMLFGYCSLNSVFLFLIGLIASLISSDARTAVSYDIAVTLKYSFGFLFMTAFCHLLLATIIGIYFLGDKIHRPI